MGDFPLPVEVLPISCEQNFRRFQEEGLKPQWRLDENGNRYVTHYGNYIIDLAIDPIPVPHALADYLDHTVGVVEHGLFLDMCDEVIIAHSNGEIEEKRDKFLKKVIRRWLSFFETNPKFFWYDGSNTNFERKI